MVLSPQEEQELLLKQEEEARLKRQEEERKKKEEELKKMLNASSGNSRSSVAAPAVVSMGALTYSELATATPNQLMQINSGNLTEALKATPALAMLKSLDPKFKLEPEKLQNDLAAWEKQFGNTPINQLDAAAINAHPLMQIPGVKSFIKEFTNQLNNLAKNENLPEDAAQALNQLNQVSDSIKDTPVKGMAGKYAQNMVSKVAKMAANQVMGGFQSSQAMKGLEKAFGDFQAGGPLPTNIPGAPPLMNAGLKFANKLMEKLNPAMKPTPTPGATNTSAQDKNKSSITQSMKSMRPSPPGGSTK